MHRRPKQASWSSDDEGDSPVLPFTSSATSDGSSSKGGKQKAKLARPTTPPPKASSRDHHTNPASQSEAKPHPRYTTVLIAACAPLFDSDIDALAFAFAGAGAFCFRCGVVSGRAATVRCRRRNGLSSSVGLRQASPS